MSRDYVINAHWALYVENFLEALHIPFVHPALSKVMDCASYEHELFRYSSLQLALAQRRGTLRSTCRRAPPIAGGASPRITGGSFPT